MEQNDYLTFKDRISSKPKHEKNNIIASRGEQLKLDHRQRVDAFIEINELLEQKFEQSPGKLCSVFAVVKRNDGSPGYCCLLCSTQIMGVSNLISHAKSKKHKQQHRVFTEKSLTPIQNLGAIFGGTMKSDFQVQLNQINDQGIIGVEYIIEIYMGATFDSIFHCVLCEGIFDLQVVLNHLTTYVHRLKYLENHFPTAYKAISSLERREQKYSFLEKVCQNIEEHYGRLSLMVVKNDEFSINQIKFYEDVLNARHIDEKLGRTFAELFDENKGDILSPIPYYDDMSSTCSLDSISTRSEFNMSPYDDYNLLRKSPSLSPNNMLSLSSISAKGAVENNGKLKENDYSRATHQEFSSDNLTSTRIDSRYNKQQTYRGQSSSPTNCGIKANLPLPNRDRSRSSQRYKSSSHIPTEISNGMDGYSPIDTSIESESLDEPISIISVLSLLSAFENHLGSLGPKMIELMTEAITMEKSSVNSSDSLLDDNDHCIVFETINEKLKGFVRADLVESKKRAAIKKTIKDMDRLIHKANERKNKKISSQSATCQTFATGNSAVTSLLPTENYDRSAIACKLLLALNETGRKDISEVELALYVDQYIKMANAKQHNVQEPNTSSKNSVGRSQRKSNDVASVPAMDSLNTENREEIKVNPYFMKNNPISSSTLEMHPSKLDEPTTLTDSNLRTLIKNFNILSDMEKHDVIVNVRELETNDPERMKRLRRDFQIDNLVNANFGPSKLQVDDKEMVFRIQSKMTEY